MHVTEILLTTLAGTILLLALRFLRLLSLDSLRSFLPTEIRDLWHAHLVVLATVAFTLGMIGENVSGWLLRWPHFPLHGYAAHQVLVKDNGEASPIGKALIREAGRRAITARMQPKRAKQVIAALRCQKTPFKKEHAKDVYYVAKNWFFTGAPGSQSIAFWWYMRSVFCRAVAGGLWCIVLLSLAIVVARIPRRESRHFEQRAAWLILAAIIMSALFLAEDRYYNKTMIGTFASEGVAAHEQNAERSKR